MAHSHLVNTPFKFSVVSVRLSVYLSISECAIQVFSCIRASFYLSIYLSSESELVPSETLLKMMESTCLLKQC